MRNMRQAARLVLNKFIEAGETEDLKGFKDTVQKLQQQEPTEETERLLQRIEHELKERG